MKHHKALALVVTVLTCVCIGDISTLRAEQPNGPQTDSVLFGRSEALVRLSIGELGRAVIRAELRMDSSAADESGDCKEPAAPDNVRKERQRLEPIMAELSRLLARRDELIRKLDEYRQVRLDAEKSIADARSAQESAAVLQALALLEDADPRFTRSGSMKEAALKQSADQATKKGSAAVKSEKDWQDVLRRAEYVQRVAETEINVIQGDIDRKLAPRDSNSLTVFQRLIAYGHQRFADSFESQAMSPEELAAKDRFKLDFVGQLVRIPPQRFVTIKSELENMTSRGDSARVQQLLARGADIYRPPGEYSALALAKIFGEARTSRMLKGDGARVQVPWDPYRDEAPRQIVTMLEKQLRRVQGFMSSIKMTKTGTREEPEYYAELLRYWGCRLGSLTGAGHRPSRAFRSKR